MDVKFYEVFSEERKLLEKYLPANVKVAFTDRTIQEEGEASAPAKCICIRTQSILPEAWYRSVEGLLSRSQGFDHLTDIATLPNNHIQCGYLGGYSSKAVAQHAIMIMFMLLRKAKKQIKQFKSFSRDNITGEQCENKKALVLGVGSIGKEIVFLARSLGLIVRGVDIVQEIDDLKYVSLEEGLSWAEICFCALPLTSSTNKLLSYSQLSKSVNNFYLINVSRGEVTPLNDCLQLVKEGKLLGLGLDVYDNEKQLADSLRKGSDYQGVLAASEEDNIIFTPHNAFNTDESTQEKARLSAAAVESFLKNKTFPTTVSV